MSALQGGFRRELIGLGGVVERNAYLVKRYVWWEIAWFVWSVANTLTIVFIAKGIEAAGGRIDVNRQTTILLIGAVIWAYLSAVFEILTETVAWERWEGTIEYTFMAPLLAPTHLFGMGIFAVLYGLVRTMLLFGLVALFFDLSFPGANFTGALSDPARRVDLVHRDRHDDGRPAADLAREGDAARVHRAGDAAGRVGRLLPRRNPPRLDAGPLDHLARDLCARGHPRRHPRRGQRARLWGDIWPLLVIGAASIPLGLYVFHRGEVYAKRHGKLKRSG